MKTFVAVAACMFAFAGVCHAAQIASSPIYAGSSQHVVLCIVYKTGSAPQTVQLQIFDQAGPVLTGVNGNCLVPTQISGTEFCSIAANNISNNTAYSCTAISSNVTNLRGSIILQDSSDTSLRSAPLR
jgi:hypothetical protein